MQGEYYLDRSTGLLSMIPPSGKATVASTDTVFVSVNATAVSLADKTDVTLKDLTVVGRRPAAFAPSRPL